jgi:hypothetical protein
VIHFQIGEAGSMDGLRISGGTKKLQDYTERWLLRSRLNPACRGRMIDLVFVYRIFDRSAPEFLPSVTLQPNNRFLLYFPEEEASGPLHASPP